MRMLDVTRPFSRGYGLSRGRIHLPAGIADVAQWREPGLGYSFSDLGGTVDAVPGGTVARCADRRGAVWGHDLQATVAARPVVGRRPRGGVRNLIYLASTAQTSEDFGAWAINAALSTREQVAGKGAFAQGWRYRDIVATDNPMLSLNVTPGITTGRHVQSVFFSYDHDQPPSNGVSLFSLQGGSPNRSAAVRITWNPDGTVASAAAASGATEAVGLDDLGDGLYRAWARADLVANGAFIHYIWPASFVGGGTSTGGIIVYAAQIERSDTGPSPYQRVTSPFDITELGVPDVWYYQGSLGGRCLVSDAPLDISGAGKASLVICLEKLTESGFSAFSHGGNALGAFEIEKPAGATRWSTTAVTAAGLVRVDRMNAFAPDLAVLSAVLDRDAGLLRLRYNGQEVDPVALTGTSPIPVALTSVLARANGSRPFEGNYYGRVYAGREFTTAEFEALEAHFMTSKGVTA